MLLPDREPYRAWSNFTFTAGTGHVYEVDLLVAAPSGLYLIEVKSWAGSLQSSGSDWIHTNPSGKVRVEKNPLHLANDKAKALKSLLQHAQTKQRVPGKLPFIQPAVYFSIPVLRVDLPANQRLHIYGPEPKSTNRPGQRSGPFPGIMSNLLGPGPQHSRHRLADSMSKALDGLLEGVGIAPSRLRFKVGAWELEREPFDIGPTWQDHLASHAEFRQEKRRVRIYVSERHAPEDEQQSIARAARREMAALHRINHPGIVQVDTLEPHEDGTALIFRHHPEAKRLDHYMTEYGDRLDADTRIRMLRQLTEAIGHAHSRRLYHRALSARSILVNPDEQSRGDRAAGDPWLRPQLVVGDWHAAARGSGGNGTTTPGAGRATSRTTSQVTPTAHGDLHLDQSAGGYLAPERELPNADPVLLDVFGLGTVAYLLLAGQAPAEDRTGLHTRLEKEKGLRPSSVSDSVSVYMDELVQAATAPAPAQRLGDVAEFLDMLATIEEQLAAAAEQLSAPTAEAEPDPLEARPGDVLRGEWRVLKRLGTGSTSRAFLAETLTTESKRLEVLKIALSDEKATRLEHEAQALRPLNDARVIRLAQPAPVRIGERTVLVLEHAGPTTVARKLRDDGRLTVDELDTFSEYLFGALDYLEGEGVTHRDIKPDNIAIRVRPNRTKQLVLFDFSLSGVSVQDVQAGTPRYLDPFIGTVQRPVYDAHAERYAAAVTLHEMASGELPMWGDGSTDDRFTEGPPRLAVEAFDPAIRDGLSSFFDRALHRDVSQRFDSLKNMHKAWRQLFDEADAARPARSTDPEADPETEVEPDDTEAVAAARDQAAAAVSLDTPLEAAGLSPRAISAAHAVEATTVGDLIRQELARLAVQPGIGQKTRWELRYRIKQWRDLLNVEDSPLRSSERRAARARLKEIKDQESAAEATSEETSETPAEPEQSALARIGLDSIAALLVPELASNGRNRTEVEATRLLLCLPDAAGTLPDLPLWPQQAQVAKAVGVTVGRIPQILTAQRKRWAREPVLRNVNAELVGLLRDAGRVMSVPELAAALLSHRASTRSRPEQRTAIATAVVRAAVELDSAQSSPRLLTRRHGDRMLVALHAGEDDGPETPAAAALLDYADVLGKAADRLAAQEVLPAPATVLETLSEVRGAEMATLDDRRLVTLAAAASQNAAASPRLEIYPRDLDPVRALRLAQAGVAPPAGTSVLAPEQVHERVRARFPELEPMDGHPKLDRLLKEAGFEVQWMEKDGKHGYATPRSASSWSGTVVSARRPTGKAISRWDTGDPEVGAAARSEQRLTRASEEGGFRALTVHISQYQNARQELVRRFGVQPVNVAGQFVAALHELVDARPKPTWATILNADVAEPGSRSAIKLREYVEKAWKLAGPMLSTPAATNGAGPSGQVLLLHDAAPLARYDAMDLLHELAERARSGGRPVWVLCPMDDPNQRPTLDGARVECTENEWIVLPDAWAKNMHRSGKAS